MVKEYEIQSRKLAAYNKIGDSYNISYYGDEAHKRIASYAGTSEFTIADYISRHMKNVEEYALSFEDNALIVNGHIAANSEDLTVTAMTLAYLSFTRGIPVFAPDIQFEITNQLKNFYCGYDVYSMADKVRFLREYPTLTVKTKRHISYLCYVLPNRRKLNADIMFLENGKIKAVTVDLMSCVTCETDSGFADNLVTLEDAFPTSKFLNAGNCLYLEVDGVRRLAYVREIKAEFLSLVYPCDVNSKPFTECLTLPLLLDALPMSAWRFYAGDENHP
ncbi:hypothetical protein AGMMS49975_20100 [Clostridia bacterium]|nr:hypothetical protein AGMMS49975_20100 [Clostridia bacterium]